MSTEQSTPEIDMIRWTFTVNSGCRDEVEDDLTDLGCDADARNGGQMVAIWDEPKGDLDAIVDQIGALNGGPCEVIHEEFHRLDLLVYHAEEDSGDGSKTAAA